MSFKREGDNQELLNNLKDQRVRGLLSAHIPEEEAKLLSNGRLTCLICQHRPVFDNVTVLSIHRRGRRHLSELSRYIKCKQEYDMKQIKAKQLKELQLSTAVKESEQLLVGQENRVYPLTLSRTSFIQTVSLGSGGKKCQILKQSGNKSDRKFFLEVPSTQLKNLKSQKHSNPTTKTTSSAVQKYLKSLPRKTSIEKVIEDCRDNYGSTSSSHCDYRGEDTPLQLTEMVHSHMVPEVQTPTPTLEPKSVQYELQLRMSGWIKDSYGNWTKDPEVEFDSDEESVPPPPPP